MCSKILLTLWSTWKCFVNCRFYHNTNGMIWHFMCKNLFFLLFSLFLRSKFYSATNTFIHRCKYHKKFRFSFLFIVQYRDRKKMCLWWIVNVEQHSDWRDWNILTMTTAVFHFTFYIFFFLFFGIRIRQISKELRWR